jgi:hypothetical protein
MYHHFHRMVCHLPHYPEPHIQYPHLPRDLTPDRFVRIHQSYLACTHEVLLHGRWTASLVKRSPAWRAALLFVSSTSRHIFRFNNDHLSTAWLLRLTSFCSQCSSHQTFLPSIVLCSPSQLVPLQMQWHAASSAISDSGLSMIGTSPLSYRWRTSRAQIRVGE